MRRSTPLGKSRKDWSGSFGYSRPDPAIPDLIQSIAPWAISVPGATVTAPTVVWCSSSASCPCLAAVVPSIRRCPWRGRSLYPPGYPGDHPCPTKGTAIQCHNDEDQSMLQRATLGVRQERYGEAELH